MKEATQMEATSPARKSVGAYANPTLTAEEREHLILEHLPQVRLIARRIHDRLPESVSLDDLISTGVVGLIAAIDAQSVMRRGSPKALALHRLADVGVGSRIDQHIFVADAHNKAQRVRMAMPGRPRSERTRINHYMHRSGGHHRHSNIRK